MADIYVPTNPVGVAMHKLRRMLALSDTFRMGCTYAEAWERIVYTEDSSEAGLPRPFAVIDVNSSDFEKVAGGRESFYRPKMNLHLYVCRDPLPQFKSINDQRLSAQDWFSGIHEDLVNIGGADDTGSFDGTSHLGFTMTQLPIATETPTQLKNSTGEFYWAVWQLNIGDE